MTSINQSHQKVNTQFIVENIHINVTATPDVIALLERGIRCVQMGRYEDAVKAFDRLIDNDDTVPDAFYYRALALLNGRRPKVAIKPTMDKADLDLATASSLDNQQAHFFYLRALIKHDFYLRNGFTRSLPAPQILLNEAARAPLDRNKGEELLMHTNANDSEISLLLYQRLNRP